MTVVIDPETPLRTLINEHQDKFEQARDKSMLRGWFVGMTMKATHGKCDPVAINRLLNKIYKETENNG